jgi:hypothetical protein
MSTYHIFYTRKNQLPTGVNISAINEVDAITKFASEHQYDEIIYIAKQETLWSLQKM